MASPYQELSPNVALLVAAPSVTPSDSTDTQGTMVSLGLVPNPTPAFKTEYLNCITDQAVFSGYSVDTTPNSPNPSSIITMYPQLAVDEAIGKELQVKTKSIPLTIIQVPGMTAKDHHRPKKTNGSSGTARNSRISTADSNTVTSRRVRRSTAKPVVYSDIMYEEDEFKDEYTINDVESSKPRKKRPASKETTGIVTPLPKRPKTQNLPGQPGDTEVQNRRCYSARYINFPRCHACISKKAGEGCRYEGLRAFRLGDDGHPSGIPIWSPRSVLAPEPSFSTSWGTEPTLVHVKRLKREIAPALLATLRYESSFLQNQSQHATLRRARETDVRVTCDSCLTSILGVSLFCLDCGREFCPDCFTLLRDEPNKDILGIILVRCFEGNHHTSDRFTPISRFEDGELELVTNEMESLAIIPEEEHWRTKASVPENDRKGLDSTPNNRTPLLSDASTPTRNLLYELFDAPLTPIQTQSEEPAFPVPDLIQTVVSDGSIPSHDYLTIHHNKFCEYDFRKDWAAGKTMVVSGLKDKFKLEWTPEWFIEHYGNQNCQITNCVTDSSEPGTVKQFFESFGDPVARGNQILKLKDWPPKADFKSSFPELYEDFQQALPMPEYTRRDGPQNIAAHFPTNALSPDLGPKMYSATASHEGDGGFGSTRLHMDMADAINIMVYAAQDAEGNNGTAAWDIYRSEDSYLIRQFLKEEFPPENHNYIDPIHSQHFFLTTALRRKLFEKYHVYSWRIYQQAGQAVFIPAGCAHQVCNLVDCIKVAVDFVSPENVARCEQLTREFRNENQHVAWKEDVLQLKTMMLYAWQSCTAIEKRLISHIAND